MESSCPRKYPSCHSTIQWISTALLRRRRPVATSGEICSSRRSLSISVFRRFFGNEFGGLRQHALQCLKIGSVILSHCLIDFPGKRPRIVDSCLDFHFWPPEMSRHRRHILFVAVDEQHDLPYGERAPLKGSLTAP